MFCTLDSEGLSRACLSVSKYTNVESIDCTLNKTFSIIKDLLLGGIRSKDAIKVIVVVDTSLDSKGHLIIDINAHLCFRLIFSFSFGEWSYTAVNSNLSFEILKFIQDLLPLTLFLLELFGDSVEFLLLESVLTQKLFL